MKTKFYSLLIAMFIIPFALLAQDEGTVVKKDRFERSKGIFIGGGPSFTLGKNIGDYSTGFSFEAGFIKRVNRVFSIGPSISYISFKYDPEQTGFNNAFISELYDEFGNYLYDLGMVINFTGGDLGLTSAALNLKLNFVPVKDDSKISVYGFAKPFVTLVSRSAVKGVAELYGNDYDPDEWLYLAEVPWEANDPTWSELGVQISDKLQSGTEFTGGIFIGPGIEFMPAKPVSIYVQAAFGYTFPLTFVSTSSYEGGTIDAVTEEYPMVKKGFPSVNLQFGLTFNF
ncbi:MAG: hypothetical protein JNM57_07500 [Cyclobacteriaceae bacterium]|nr:hypothetical protein [Cyclobacteriaceae bacterium]